MRRRILSRAMLCLLFHCRIRKQKTDVYEKITDNKNAPEGSIFYVYTDDANAVIEEVSDMSGIIFSGDKSTIKFTYFMYMVIAGILLVISTGLVVVAGEVRSEAYVDIQQTARRVIDRIGYNRSEYQYDAASCGIRSAIH